MMLSQNIINQIDKELLKYPKDKKRSAVMAALRFVQEEQNYLSQEAIEEVANYLGIPPVQALEVATFYSMYNLKPVGKYKLTVCTNVPCALSGGVNTLEFLQEKLGIRTGETTADGKFTLQEGECMGACGDAPVMLINNHRLCSFMHPEAILEIFKELT